MLLLMSKLYIVILLLLVNTISFGAWQPVSGKNGMVATADKNATQVGINILQIGGNAIDAAVAIGFTLAVTYPRAGNIGGGGFMIICSPDNKIYTIDYREKAPVSATKDMYLDANRNIIENLSLEGYLASGVPGTVSGLYEAHRKFGKLKWADLIEPAIKYAEEGFVIDRYTSESLADNFEVFQRFPSSNKIFTKNGEKYSEGELLIQKDLARTLKLIRDNKSAGFYTGEIADLIATDMKRNKGLITKTDLVKYQSKWREPIEFTYRNYSIYSMAPPSSGGIILAEILNALENYNLSEIGWHSANLIHVWAEIEKQAYADRAEYLGDADFVQIPIANLVSKEYAKRLYQNVDPINSTPSQSMGESHLQKTESTQTTHFSIVDQWGYAVSNTYTLNDSYGSGVVIEGTGILMNNEMDDFAIKAGIPNLYGLIGSKANEIYPEKRMLSSMTPTIVTKNDSLFLILGTPGGSTIITTVAQVISNVIDHKMNIRKAVESPRFHHQWLPDEIKYEKNWFSTDVLNKLRDMGNKIRLVSQIGDVQAIIRDNKYNEWQGWSDPRGNGITIGY